MSIILTIVYMLLTYRFLPRGAVAASEETASESSVESALSRFHEIAIYVIFAGVMGSVSFAEQLGDYLAVIPVVGVLLLIVTKAMTRAWGRRSAKGSRPFWAMPPTGGQ